jgi:hypothetical protein
METSKPWYLSRTIWASLVAVAAAGGGLIGLPVDSGDAAALTDAALQIVAAIGAVMAIVGRVSARHRIGPK